LEEFPFDLGNAIFDGSQISAVFTEDILDLTPTGWIARAAFR
jgi:hypothetical protein